MFSTGFAQPLRHAVNLNSAEAVLDYKDRYLSGGFVEAPGANPIFILDGVQVYEYRVPPTSFLRTIVTELIEDDEWFMVRPDTSHRHKLATLYVTSTGADIAEDILAFGSYTVVRCPDVTVYFEGDPANDD
ncbi:MAG: hypothetical protein RJS97_02890 [Parvibaculaceae bacterium]